MMIVITEWSELELLLDVPAYMSEFIARRKWLKYVVHLILRNGARVVLVAGNHQPHHMIMNVGNSNVKPVGSRNLNQFKKASVTRRIQSEVMSRQIPNITFMSGTRRKRYSRHIFGVKPFYCTLPGIYYASEVKAIYKILRSRPDIRARPTDIWRSVCAGNWTWQEIR